MQKTYVTIGLFNAEYLQMSDIPINTHTHTQLALHTISTTGADYIFNIRADARNIIYGFSCIPAREATFFIPITNTFKKKSNKDDFY